MEWVIVNPSSIHEVCGNLGYTSVTGEYRVKMESCENALDCLLAKLNGDGPSLRTRRSLGISQVIKRDIFPLLVSATVEAPATVYKIIKLLSNLTSPIEVLVPQDYLSTEEGKQVVYELDSLLRGMKSEFADFKATKAIVDHLKDLTSKEKKLLPEECEQLSEGLLLLRNVLHIPHKENQVQNQILWNLFAQNLDKVLLHLMTCEQKNLWVITVVQLIALIYKDQHISHLQKLLNLWLENSMSESSEDNESNTSLDPEDLGNSSSPMLTSDPTSDSSDNGGRSLKDDADVIEVPSPINENQNDSANNKSSNTPNQDISKEKAEDATASTSNSSSTSFRHPYPLSQQSVRAATNKNTKQYTLSSGIQKCYTKAKSKNKAKMTCAMIQKERMSDADSGISSMNSSNFSNDTSQATNTNTDDSSETSTNPAHAFTMNQENSYKQDCNSTSSNEDESQKPTSSGKQRDRDRITILSSHAKLRNPSVVTVQDKHDIKRKKLHKRSTRNRKTTKALVHHHNPTAEDIENILKEFTVDFLLKGYGPLVSNLQEQLSINPSIEIDRSHFLWLLTYFLKFASQLELDLEHITPVLSYKMLSYLVYEGISMCENLSLCTGDLKPHLRRMHLVVTALREFIQAVEIYSKMPSYSREDKEYITKLRNDMLDTEECRYLFLLLIRYFKPGVQSKQYLQDLVTTNHVFLLFLEKVSSSPDYQGSFKMTQFIKEFSSPLVMQQYGHLLEDFSKNGLFINDCIFTMMHHIAGDLTCPESLFQPLILKTFSKIWEVEFEVRDDWADLIEYIIQRFMKASNDEKRNIFKSGTSNMSEETGWTKDEIERLYWLYTSFANCSDPIAKILESYGETPTGKTRESVLNQLLHQRIIGYNQFLLFLAAERFETGDQNDGSSSASSINANPRTPPPSTLIEQLRSANKTYSIPCPSSENDALSISTTCLHRPSMPVELLDMDLSAAEVLTQIVAEGQDLSFIQKQLLEACYVKITLEKEQCSNKFMDNDSGEQENNDKHEAKMEPIPYHYCLLGQSIPIVPWSHDQEMLLLSPPCFLLLHKLGFHLPGDVGKRFPRIPHFWTADVLYSVAKKLGAIPENIKLKFDPSTLTEISEMNDKKYNEKYPNQLSILAGNNNSEKPGYSMPRVGLGVGVVNSFTQGHGSYGYSGAAQSVNWMTLVHKSKQLIERHSEAVITSISTSFSDSESEHMDDCASLKALPPTDHSEDVTMMSEDSGQEEDNENKEGEEDQADL